ncbi:MAG TPA: glycine oxidase ThiO [Rhizomicrobium sp.]|nr:glycine oxidase ThiO [Rhizomicrobium sp.]
MRIIVIGAGIAGLSIGWRLAEGGADVTVLDRANAGRGATWAAAGMIAATAESAEASGAEAEFARASAEAWPAFAAEVEEESGAQIFYRKDGALIAALTQSEAEAFKARAGAQFIGADEALRREPMLQPGIAGALWDPNEAQVDNRALSAALVTALLRVGGKLSINETAIRFEMEGARIIGVRTPFHVHLADAFVIAAGAWTSRIEGLPPGTVPEISPVKGEMISLALPNGARLPKSLVWGNEIYAVPRQDRLLIGATAEEAGFDTSLTQIARNWLHEHAAGLMPAVQHWEIAEHWAGLRPRARDGLPVLGASAVESVFVASGQFRNGILFAPLIAAAMCDLVLNRCKPPEIAGFSPLRAALT